MTYREISLERKKIVLYNLCDIKPLLRQGMLGNLSTDKNKKLKSGFIKVSLRVTGNFN